MSYIPGDMLRRAATPAPRTMRDTWALLEPDAKSVILRLAAKRIAWPTRHIDFEDIEAVTRREHIEFIGLAIERALMGQKQYGALDLATDKRDFRREKLEEDVDGAFYEQCAAIQAEMAANGYGVSP